MNHFFQTRTYALLCIIIVFSASVSAQDLTATFFGSSAMTKIMDHKDCTGVRFYNVVKPGTSELTTMAIGIRADNTEISNISNRYHMFLSVSGSRVTYDKLSKNKARDLCQEVKGMNIVSFSASFSKSELVGMLSSGSSNGIIIQQKTTESLATFEAGAGILAAGRFDPAPNSIPKISSEPCPSYCGNSSNYVNM